MTAKTKVQVTEFSGTEQPIPANITYATYAERIAAIRGEKAVEPEAPKMGFVAAVHLGITDVQATLSVHKDMHGTMVENAKQEVLDRLIQSGAI